jgi:hypothetical protein
MGWFGRGGKSAAPGYTRQESEAVRKLYEPNAPFAPRSKPEVEALVAALARKTRLPRGDVDYPVDASVLASTARALEEAVAELFGGGLRVEDESAAQLDVLVGSRLLAPELRRSLASGRVAELQEGEERVFAEAYARIEVPREALLYYALGAWWGEWLVRHRRAAWWTLAAMLIEADRRADARVHLEAVIAKNEKGLADEARELLAKVGG